MAPQIPQHIDDHRYPTPYTIIPPDRHPAKRHNSQHYFHQEHQHIFLRPNHATYNTILPARSNCVPVTPPTAPFAQCDTTCVPVTPPFAQHDATSVPVTPPIRPAHYLSVKSLISSLIVKSPFLPISTTQRGHGFRRTVCAGRQFPK
jgi:hypothetical protein